MATSDGDGSSSNLNQYNTVRLQDMNYISKFRGCLVSSLMGDCLGAPFEGEMNVLSKSVMTNYFRRLMDPKFEAPYRKYTDDTAMMKGVAESLVVCKKFDEFDMAKRFYKEYYNDPKRGYGANVRDVFRALQREEAQDPYGPAKDQFGGTGSYGNGGSMRVAPVALFAAKNYDQMLDLAKKSALITHSNKLGYNGAVLQCMAVHQALHMNPAENLDVMEFVDKLLEKMVKLEKTSEDSKPDDTYTKKLQKMKKCLEKGVGCSPEWVVEELGNDISAQNSVPTAIYSFLLANQTEDMKIDGVEKTLSYAISWGGDTDTIACMAGAIAGAYHGVEGAPPQLMKHCEGVKTVIKLADDLYKLVYGET